VLPRLAAIISESKREFDLSHADSLRKRREAALVQPRLDVAVSHAFEIDRCVWGP
jgi:hypothetical protein